MQKHLKIKNMMKIEKHQRFSVSIFYLKYFPFFNLQKMNKFNLEEKKIFPIRKIKNINYSFLCRYVSI